MGLLIRSIRHAGRQFWVSPVFTAAAVLTLALGIGGTAAIFGLLWAYGPSAEVSKQTQRLLALQRESGGWGQWPTMAPDAYATGQALYALRTAGISPQSGAYQRGAQYLLRTQLEDGTWFVRSRAFAFQRYFDAGFPHGTDQFISAAATAWATIALAYTL